MVQGLGFTCNRKDLPFSETIYRNHNKEPQKGMSFRLQVGLEGLRVPGFNPALGSNLP